MISKKSFLSLALICSIGSMQAMQLTERETFIPERLGQLAVIHNNNRFYVEDENKAKPVQNCFIDKELRGISSERLSGFLKNGYLSVNRMSDGEYSLRAQGRLNGGGPVWGFAAYVGAKVAGYVSVAAICISVPLSGGATAPLAAHALEFTAAGGIEATAAAVGTAVTVLPTP